MDSTHSETSITASQDVESITLPFSLDDLDDIDSLDDLDAAPKTGKDHTRKMASYRLPVDLLAKLKAFSALNGVDQSDVVRYAIIGYTEAKMAEDDVMARLVRYACDRWAQKRPKEPADTVNAVVGKGVMSSIGGRRMKVPAHRKAG